MKAKLWVLTALMVLPLGGCTGMGKPQERIDHYVFEYPAPLIPGLDPIQAVVRVERFSVAPPYNTSRIVYRDKDFTRETYNYHRWRANPGDLIAHFLYRDFRDSGLFRGVFPGGSRFPASFVLEGTVEELFELDGTEQWEAVLTLSIVLTAQAEPDSSRKVVFQGTYSEIEPCARKNPRAFTEATSRAMARVSKTIIEDVYRVLKPEG